MQSVYCKSCGKPSFFALASDKPKFCSHCGASLTLGESFVEPPKGEVTPPIKSRRRNLADLVVATADDMESFPTLSEVSKQKPSSVERDRKGSGGLSNVLGKMRPHKRD